MAAGAIDQTRISKGKPVSRQTKHRGSRGLVGALLSLGRGNHGSVNGQPKRPFMFLLNWLQLCLLLVGPFLLGCLLVLLGIGVYLWLEEPPRLVMLKVETNGTNWALVLIEPQPLRVPAVETNLMIIKPPVAAYLNGAAANAAIWVNGKSFKSGRRAAWELIRRAVPLWFVCAGAVICDQLLNRYECSRKGKSGRIILAFVLGLGSIFLMFLIGEEMHLPSTIPAAEPLTYGFMLAAGAIYFLLPQYLLCRKSVQSCRHAWPLILAMECAARAHAHRDIP